MSNFVLYIIMMIFFLFYLIYFCFMLIKSYRPSYLLNNESINVNPLTSIIVPTYNERYTILPKLKNLETQNYQNMEIIIIDSGSNDGTLDEIKNYQITKNFLVKIIEEQERKGKSSAINKAIKFCSGEIIILTDADVLWEKEAIKKIVKHFSKSQVGAVTGREVILNPNQSTTTKLEKKYRYFFDILRQGESELDSTHIFYGPLMAFRSILFEPLPEDTISDDHAIALQIRKKGFKTIFDPDIEFYEYAPPNFKSNFNQKIRRGQGMIQVFFRNLDILFNPKYGNFGRIIFPSEFFMHIISPIFVVVFILSFSYELIYSNIYVLYFYILTSIFIYFFSRIFKIPFPEIIISFISYQIILFFSLIYNILRKPNHKWNKILEVRELAKND